MADTLKATPRNELLYQVGSGLQRVKDAMNKQRQLSQVEQRIRGNTPQFPLGNLIFNEALEAIKDYSYQGSSPFRGTRNIQTLQVDPRMLDVAGLIPFAAPAAKLVKQGAVKLAPEMAAMAERYALQPQYVVPPEGNLNFTSSITRDKLKGPEKQMVGNFISQAKNIPGVTKEGLEEAILKSEQLRDPTTVLTKEQFENALPASQYNKVDLGASLAEEDALNDLREHFMDQAIEYVDPTDVYRRRSIPDQYMEIVDALAMGEVDFSSLTPRAKKDLSSIFSLDESMPDSHIQDIIDMDLRSTHFEMADEIAMDLARDEMDANPGTYYSTDGQPTYAFKRIQRLVPEETEGYFGIGLTHPEHEGWYKHYSNAPKNTIGHVRGTITKEPVEIAGGVIVPENSAIIEEIQSDVQQKMAQKGPLKQVHGALFKTVVQHALEKGANRIYLPSAKTIANPLTNDRGIENLPLYQRIYDDEVIKQGLKPLSKIPGVKVTPIETVEQPTRGLRPGYKPTFYDTPNEASKLTMEQLGVPDEIRDEMHVMTLFRPQAVSDKVAAWLRSKNLTPEQFFNTYKEVNKNNLAELTAKHEALLEQEKLDNTIDIPARKVLLYNVIDIDPEAAEYILKGPGQTTPGYAKGGEVLKATPRNEAMYGVGDFLEKIKEALNSKRQLSPLERELAGKYADPENQWSVGNLLLGQVPEVLKDWSYQGSSPVHGTRNIQTTSVDPRVVDVATVAAPLVNPVLRLAKTAAPTIARQAVNLADKYGVSPNMYVVKPEEGQWLPDIDLRNVSPMDRISGNAPKSANVESLLDRITTQGDDVESKAINSWIKGPLKTYVKKRMGTPSDELRMLHEQDVTHMAEKGRTEGIFPYQHYPHERLPNDIATNRRLSGFSEEGMGSSFYAKSWEGSVDKQFSLIQVKDIPENMQEEWMTKLPPDTVLYGLKPGAKAELFGFDRLVSTLEKDLASGKIRPEQVNKLSVLDVAKRTADNAVVEINEALPVVRQYPEGMKWVELTAEDENTLKNIFEYEGRKMNHCLGEADCAPIFSGESRIFSLRNKNNTPYATIEVDPSTNTILQISGRGNSKIRDNYLPYARDFVLNSPLKNKQWTKVEDAGYAGLVPLPDNRVIPENDFEQIINNIKKQTGAEITQEDLEPMWEQISPHFQGFAAGGFVASDYDEDQIDKLSDEIMNFEEGGYVQKASRYGRKGQYRLAKMIGIGPEVEFATEIPERYFPANEQHNARGDAMRHMLLQAQLAKRSPLLAKTVGWAHENLSGPQGDAEKAMDEYNDELGRQIGLTAKDKADMVYQALQAIDKGRARTLTKEQMGEGYAEGGLVYNDAHIDSLADQLLGVK